MIHKNTLSYLCWILLSCASLQGPTLLTKARSDDKTMSIFLLAGQSNMAGRGGVINDRWDGVVPEECRRSQSILRLDADLRWVEAEEPLHRDIDTSNKTCGIGPGMPFAHGLLGPVGLGLIGPVIGLVPCAVGGTSISEWARGGYLYRQLVKRAWASLREGGTLQALIWYQGESDTVTRRDAEEYKQRLEDFFADLRADLQSPMLPIIQVAIASGVGPYIEIVRQAQMGVDLLNLKTVDAMGLTLEPDHLHLTTLAQLHLGHKLAQAFLQFLPTPTPPTHIQSNKSNILHKNCFHTHFHVFFIVFSLVATVLQKL